MTRVSKKDLDPKHLQKLYTQLGKMIAHLDQKKASVFLEELFGREEKIMIAKRLAAVVMLIEKNSNYRIAQLLQMSPSTVERLRQNYHTGAYEGIEKMLLKNRQAYEDFWKTLEIVLRAGLPPRNKGRWKSTFEALNK